MKFAGWLNTLFRIGTILNVQIYLDFTFFVGLGLFSSSLSTLYAGQLSERLVLGYVSVILLYSSVLLHEFGHLLTARRFGIGTERVTLFIFGGMASLKGLGTSPAQAALIALAGPLVSATLALCAALILLVTGDSLTGNGAVMLHLMKTLNTSLFVFNLLPILPLDGGRISVALIWATKYRFFERGYFYAVQSATRFVSLPGILFATGAWTLFTGFNPYLLLLAYVLGLSLRSEYRNAETRTALDRMQLWEVMTPVVEPDMPPLDYLRTLKTPFKHHYTIFPVEGKKVLTLVATLENGEVSPYQNLGLECKTYDIPVAGSVDSGLSVGEFLARMRQAPPDSFYAVTQGDRWIGVVSLAVTARIAHEFQEGFADAEGNLPG